MTDERPRWAPTVRTSFFAPAYAPFADPESGVQTWPCLATFVVRGFDGQNGLRFMCPECYRFMEHGACRLHGRMSGDMVYRLKALVRVSDLSVNVDGHGYGGPQEFQDLLDEQGPLAVLVAWEQAVAYVSGWSRADCEAFTKEAMSLETGGEETERRALNRTVGFGQAKLQVPPLRLNVLLVKFPGDESAPGGYCLWAGPRSR